MEHLGNHEHHSYAVDEFDDIGPSPLSSTYRTYQTAYGAHTPLGGGAYGTSSPAGFGSPRQTTSQLRANRAAAAAADPYINPASASPTVSGLHSLHSKGSNLSTSTFMPRSQDQENGSGSDMISSPLTPTPGAVTPTPASMVPSTSSLPTNSTNNANQATPKSSLVDPSLKNGEEKSASTVSQSSSVVKSKSSAITATTPQSPRVRDRRSGRERERDRDRDREGRYSVYVDLDEQFLTIKSQASIGAPKSAPSPICLMVQVNLRQAL
jgi:hypothetical protein